MPKYSARLFRKNFDGPRIPLPPRNVSNGSSIPNPYPTKNSNSPKNSRSRNSETASSANAREDFKDQVVENFVDFLVFLFCQHFFFGVWTLVIIDDGARMTTILEDCGESTSFDDSVSNPNSGQATHSLPFHRARVLRAATSLLFLRAR